MTKSMALSGNTLPQISTDNASISGTFHIVTSDGAGVCIQFFVLLRNVVADMCVASYSDG